MGLFDNLMKAVEDGAIEKSLAGAVDKLEAGLDKAIEKAEQVGELPQKALDTAQAKQEHVSQALQNATDRASETLDTLGGKDS